MSGADRAVVAWVPARYNGRVFFGLDADRDSVGDVEVLADLIEQEVDELVEATA